MTEPESYSQWSAKNALDKDPLDALREYTDYARMQYLRSGASLAEIEPQLRAGVEDKLKADGKLREDSTAEELQDLDDRLFAPKQNADFDAAAVQTYLALDDPDSDTEESKANNQLLIDYLAKKKYSPELAAPLEGAVMELLKDGDLVRRARLAAVDRGDYEAVSVTDSDGSRSVYSGANEPASEDLPMLADSLLRVGALDGGDLALLQDNYRKVFDGKGSVNRIQRSSMFNEALDSLSQSDSEIAQILAGAASAAAKTEYAPRQTLKDKAFAGVIHSAAAALGAAGEVVGAMMDQQRVGPTVAETTEYQVRQGDRTASELIREKLLSNEAFRKRFSEDEIAAFTNDRVLAQTNYKFDNTKPETGIRELSTGAVVIAPALLVNTQKLEDALSKNSALSEQQREFARTQRASLLDVRVPQMLKTITASSDAAVSAFAVAKQEGKSDREFVEQWLSDENNYSAFGNTLGSTAYALGKAIGDTGLGVAALLGSETATKMMLESQAEQSRFAEYGSLFGDDFGIAREALNALPAVAVDLGLTMLTAGAGRAVTAAARAGSMTARTAAKGAVAGALDAAATGIVRAATGASAQTAAALQAAGRSFITRAATATIERVLPVALPAFNRSASNTYVSIYGSLPESMTHAEKHKQSLSFALAAGIGTAAITAGLSALGAGGIEKLGVRTAAKGIDDLTYREAKVLFEAVKNEGKAVSDAAFQKALAAEVGAAFRNLTKTSSGTAEVAVRPLLGREYRNLASGVVKGFRDEAFEEALDQSINMAIEDAALKRNRPVAEKLQQIWNAGLIGGLIGGGVTTASQAFAPTASAQTKALQQRVSVLDGIAKRLSTSGAPETAASVQRMMDVANAAAVASTKKDTAAAATQAAKAPTTTVRTVAEQLEFKFDDPRGVPPADTRLADLIGERVYIGETGINGIAEIDPDTGEVVINFSKPTKVKDKPNVTRYVLGTKFQKATGVTLKPKIKTLAKAVGALPVGTRVFSANKMEFVLPAVEAVDKARAAGKPLLVLQRDENQRVVGVTIRGAALVESPTTTTDATITDPDLIREVLRLYPEPAPAPAPATGEQLELDFAAPDGQFEFGFMSNQAPQPTPEEVADQAELDSLGGPQEIQLTFDDAPDFDEVRGSVALIDGLIGSDPVLTTLHATRIDQKGFSALATTFDPDQIADAGEALQEAQEAAAALLDDPDALSNPKRFRQNSLLFVQLNKTLDPLRVKYDRIVQIRNQIERRTRSAAKRSAAVQRSQRAATRPAAQPVGRTEGPRPAGPPRDVEALTELLNADPVLAALNTTGGNNLRSLLGTFSEAQRTAAQDLLAEAEGLVAQQPAPALQQRLRILNFKLAGLNRLAATQQQPEAPAPEPTPTPEPEPTPTPEPEPTTPRGENRVPKLQEFMDKDPELAALVEEALAAGTDILFATSRAQAVTELGLPELPPNRKSSKTLATAFVRTDGSTGIVLYSGAMQKGKDLKKIIAHERIHVEQYRFEDTPEGAAAAAAAEATFDTESPEYDKKLDSFMRKEYPSWDKLSPRGKLREANRAAVEGLLTGETSHFKPGFFSYLTRFLRHVQEVFQGDSSMATYTRAIVEQISKEAPKPAAKKAARKAPTPAPAPTPSPAAKKAARTAQPEPAAEVGMQVLTDAEQLEIMALFASIDNRMNKGQILGGYSGNLSQVTPAREIRRLLAAKGYKESDTPTTWVDAAATDKKSPRDIEKLNALREWAFSGGKPAPETTAAEPQAPAPTRGEIEDWLNDGGNAQTLVGASLLDKQGKPFKIEKVRIDDGGEPEFVTDDPATETVPLTVNNLIEETNPESFTPYLEAGNVEPEAEAPAPEPTTESDDALLAPYKTLGEIIGSGDPAVVRAAIRNEQRNQVIYQQALDRRRAALAEKEQQLPERQAEVDAAKKRVREAKAVLKSAAKEERFEEAAAAKRKVGNEEYTLREAEARLALLNLEGARADVAEYEGYAEAPKRLIRYYEETWSEENPDTPLYGPEAGAPTPEPSTPPVVPQAGTLSMLAPQSQSTLNLLAGRSAGMPQFMRDSLETAQAMAAAGKTSEEIRAVTGWFPGPYDGKMRWEIPDNQASLIPTEEFNQRAIAAYGGVVFNTLNLRSALDRIRAGTVLRLGDVLKHDALFSAYPALADLPFFPIGGNIANGSFRVLDGEPMITATVALSGGRISDETLSTILHEVQHWIQRQEGFARGGSTNNLITQSDLADANKFREAQTALLKYEKALQSYVDSLAEEQSKKRGFLGRGGPDAKRVALLESLISEVQKSVNDLWAAQKVSLNIDKGSTRASLLSAINAVSTELGSSWVVSNRNKGLDMLYRLLAGEIEARDVQARRTLTPEQRAATAPYSSENIAPDQAIVMFGAEEQASMPLLPDSPALKQNIADIPAALQGMLPAGFTLAADPNMDGALGYNAVTDPTVVRYNPNLVGSLTVGLARADALATLRTAVDHELGHAAAEAEFGEESYVALATELGEDMLSNIASIYYSLVEPDFNLRAERIKADRGSGALPDWKIAAEWVRMEIERIANGRTSEQRMLFLRSRPSLLAKFIDALNAFVVRLRARFFENPTTGTAASISNAARQLRKLRNGGYLPAPPKADPNALGDAAEFERALTGASDSTLFTMPLGAATKAGQAEIDGFWRRLGKRFVNLPSYLKVEKEARDGIMAVAANQIEYFQKRVTKLLAKAPNVSLDDVRDVLGRTTPALDNAARARVRAELDVFINKLPADMDEVLAEEMIQNELYRLQRVERIASNTAFAQQQADAQQRIRNAGYDELADLLVKFRKDIDNMSERFKHLNASIDDNLGVYLTRTFDFFTTEGWALMASNKGVMPDGTQLAMFRGKEVDFNKLRDNAAKAYEADVVAEAQRRGEVATAEEIQERTHKKLDQYLAALQRSTEQYAGTNTDSIKKDIKRFLPKRDLDNAVLELLGVIEDPLENAMRTMANVAKIAANDRFLSGARSTLLSMGLASNKPDAKNSTPAFGKRYADAALDPLEGLYTTPEIARALQAEFGEGARRIDSTTDTLMQDVGTWVRHGAAFATTMKTLPSVGFHARNMVSGQFLLTTAQGVAPANKHTLKAFKLSFLANFESWKRTPEEAAEIERLIELQMLKDDTSARALKDMTRGFEFSSEQELDALFLAYQEAASGNPGALKAVFKKAGVRYDKAIDILASLNNVTDGAVKVQAYYTNLEALKADKKQQLAQEAADPEQRLLRTLELKAADKTKLCTPTHSRRFDWVKSMNKTSAGLILFPFAGWKTEVFRTMYNIPRLAYKEITQGEGPAERAMGVKRIAGWTTVMFGAGGAMGLFYQMIFSFIAGLGDDEDRFTGRELTPEELFALRESMPEWQKGHDVFTRLTENGVMVIDMTAITPYAQLTDMGNIVLEGIQTGEGLSGRKVASYVVNQLIGMQIAAKTASEVLNNQNDFGQPIYRENDNAAEVFGKSMLHYAEGAMEPAISGFLRRVTRSGEQDVKEMIVGEFTGARPRIQKLSEIEYRAFRGVKKMLDDSAQIKAALVTGRKLDDSEVVDTLLEHQEALNRTQRKLAKTIEGLKGLGSTRGSIFGSAKNAGFSAQRVELAEQGRNYRWTPNQAWLKGVYQNMTRTGEDDPMNRINAIRRTLQDQPAVFNVVE